MILLTSLFFRFPSFYLPHNHGDQVQYLALAAKLDKFGFSQYNLREVDILKSEDNNFIAVFPAQKDTKGNLLKALPGYYDEPLFHKPPFFIYALVFSHRVFAGNKPYAAVNINLGPKVRSIRPKPLFTTQFYCAFVPILFSLLFITATFFLGRFLFSNRVGIYAAILLSISPIELLSAQRIWADDLTAFFVTLAILFYCLGKQRRSHILASLAGIAAGLSALSKPTGNIVFLIILAYEIWLAGKDTWKIECLVRAVFNKATLSFLVSFILVILPWHLQILKAYGSVFYFPALSYPELINQNAWFKFVFNRPWYMYLVNIPVQTPLLFLVYPAVFGIFKRYPGSQDRANRDKKVLLLIWILMFLFLFSVGKLNKEMRYMLPAYSAIAILAAEVLETIQRKLNAKLSPVVVNLVIGAMIILCAWWSVSLGLSHVFINSVAIKMPF